MAITTPRPTRYRSGAWWTHEPNANIGLVVGEEAGIVVIDVDTPIGHGVDGRATLSKLEIEHGSFSTAVRTPSGGAHFYFEYPAEFIGKMLKKEIGPGVELKYKGYVVAPPSVVNGVKYFGVTKADKMPHEWVALCIKEQPSREDWDRVRPRGSGPSICAEHGMSMRDVLTLPATTRKVSDGYLIEHPLHGATGGGNLFVNTTLDLWCCYRHGTGGDPLTWVAVREGFVSCEDAGPLDVETALKCKDVLRREGLIQEERREPEEATPGSN